MAKGKQSGSSGTGLAILVVIAVLWWLRWLILAGAVIALAVIVTRWSVGLYAAHRAAEQARLRDIRQRAEIQNAQVLRGDPHGFYGQYPLPDRELIPRWYRPG
ncbi:hypothetical protein [Mycolicibacter sinensis]|jgi:hypothetical protein|uniref:Uncharacterized protein n=1 Tax=Mycolicibacter sinensis (strain JDM601) TaxID=875328 RepID=A0A1A2E0I3_MYCSD|nr:hypothetical protein [Mycolicibacter sinensis]OBF99027.1 hypothetical protein A5772_14060 [Mycolicibacter sinensis]OBG01019.1 hypothetical protein A5771_18215 [Mycolicibacter sinensis]